MGLCVCVYHLRVLACICVCVCHAPLDGVKEFFVHSRLDVEDTRAALSACVCLCVHAYRCVEVSKESS
eukprot:m.171448 g.171448  ORF g.171448 m.171448 type:complete len:68 (-) comp15285_c2_seq19:36-239(-)